MIFLKNIYLEKYLLKIFSRKHVKNVEDIFVIFITLS